MKRGFVWVLAAASLLPTAASAGTGVLNGVNSQGSGEYLFWDQQITKGCRYRLVMQTDGNLVTYNGYNQPVWSSGTWGQGGGYAFVSSTGIAYVMDWYGRVLWQAGRHHPCDLYTNPYCTWSKLYQRDNGNLEILFNGSYQLWASNAIGPTMTGDCSLTPEKVTRVQVNEDRLGGDYRAIEISEARPSWCGGYCAQDHTRCQSYTYVPAGVKGPNAVCFLKDSVPAPSYGAYAKGMVSGVIVRR